MFLNQSLLKSGRIERDTIQTSGIALYITECANVSFVCPLKYFGHATPLIQTDLIVLGSLNHIRYSNNDFFSAPVKDFQPIQLILS